MMKKKTFLHALNMIEFLFDFNSLIYAIRERTNVIKEIKTKQISTWMNMWRKWNEIESLHVI